MREGDMRFENVPVPVDYVRLSGHELASINDYARLLADRFPDGHVDTLSTPVSGNDRTLSETVAVHDEAVEIVHEVSDSDGTVIGTHVIKAEDGALWSKEGDEWARIVPSPDPSVYSQFARANRLMMEAGVRLLNG